MYSIQNDDNIKIIRRVIEQLTPGSEFILFGSRVSGKINDSSDYDIIISVSRSLTVTEKRSLSSIIRKQLAEYLIDSDVIVSDEAGLSNSLNKPGSIIKEALKQGVRI